MGIHNLEGVKFLENLGFRRVVLSRETPLEEVKVVIFGQDPYHEPNQAMGLSFSVPDTTKVPPSLVNIYKEIEMEYSSQFKNRGGDLTYLAKQGVLLLNTILTVREHCPLSHNIKEYQLFMQDIISVLNELDQPIVFLLWGGNAKSLSKYLLLLPSSFFVVSILFNFLHFTL